MDSAGVESLVARKPRPSLAQTKKLGIVKNVKKSLHRPRPKKPAGPCSECDKEQWYLVRSENRWRCQACHVRKNRERIWRKNGDPVESLCAKYPGFTARIRAHSDRARISSLAGVLRRDGEVKLRASEFYPEIHPALDKDLHDADEAFLTALSEIAKEHQRAFFDLYRKDPADALRWKSLPGWKRPIRKREPQDKAIWDFFTALRMSFESAGGDPVATGRFLQQIAGKLAYVKDTMRLVLVLGGYAAELAKGSPPEDRGKPPWCVKPVENSGMPQPYAKHRNLTDPPKKSHA